MGRKPKEKTSQVKSMGIFDWLKEIQTSKRHWSSFTDEDKESFNCYMINKFLSMNENYIELVNMVQNIPYTEKEKYYNIYREMIPKGFVFSRYIKSTKESYSKEILEAIALYFSCSKKEAEEYIPLLGKDNIQDIFVKVGMDEKIIKKLIKEI